jgi:hypothetical protein
MTNLQQGAISPCGLMSRLVQGEKQKGMYVIIHTYWQKVKKTVAFLGATVKSGQEPT